MKILKMSQNPKTLIALDMSGSFSYQKGWNGKTFLQQSVSALSNVLDKDVKDLEIFSWGDDKLTGAIRLNSETGGSNKKRILDHFSQGFDCAGYAQPLADYVREKSQNSAVQRVIVLGDGDVFFKNAHDLKGDLGNFKQLAQRTRPSFTFIQVKDDPSANQSGRSHFNKLAEDLQKIGFETNVITCRPDEIEQAVTTAMYGLSFTSSQELSTLRADFEHAQKQLKSTRERMQGIYNELREARLEIHRLTHGQASNAHDAHKCCGGKKHHGKGMHHKCCR